jgi:hypothetical protein
MALNNYGALRAAVGDWLLRNDLSDQIADFIYLAEVELSRRVRRCSVRTTITITDRDTALPSDAVELRSIYLQSGEPTKDLPLTIMSPEGLAEMRARRANVAYRPLWASMLGNHLIVAPDPDKSYTAEVIYFQQLPFLTGASDSSSNTLLAEAPDAYLYGALLQAAPFLEHDSRMPVWQQKFDNAINQLNDVRDREEYNASIRPIRLPIVFN